jgi:predicted DNA-binding transcriptional regulator YafY
MAAGIDTVAPFLLTAMVAGSLGDCNRPSISQVTAMTQSAPDPRLLAAIVQKRLIGLHFKDAARVAEPHDYGIRGGRETVLAWQLEPEAGWRWFEIERISNLKMLERSFAGSRAAPSGKHHQWDVLFARVGSSK